METINNGETGLSVRTKINENFAIACSRCTTIQTLTANTETTIAGDTFTPNITSEPIDIIVYLAGVKQNMGSVAYILNGDVYDIIIGTTEEIIDAKINVIL